MRPGEHQAGKPLDPLMTTAIVGTITLAVALAWLAPSLAAWLHSGQLPGLGLIDALGAVPHLLQGDPAAAYPRATARLLPGATGFWVAAGLAVLIVGSLVFAFGREIEIRMGRTKADRRWWNLAGRRPHDWGRYRTLGELIVERPSAERVIVGHVSRPRVKLAITPTAQMAVIAAPRTGKSSGLVIPALLEHEGPVVTTSVRTDVAEHTIDRRRRLGRTWVWDPFSARSDAWDLLQGCEDWEHALLVARWLGQARRLGEASSQAYFDDEAEGLIAPYLHAAALAPGLSATDVYGWILDRDDETAMQILADAGAEDARNRLGAVYSYTERQRDGIIGTAAVQLKAYGHPAAARTARRGEGITPEDLFDGPNTLYIVAGRDHQQLLAPLVVTMVSSLMYWLGEEENRTGRGLQPQALLALDETASIAPLENLPQMLATSMGSGARFMTVWHSVAQIRRLFGVDAAAEILALSQAKVFMGSITDEFTRREVVELLGRREMMRSGQAAGREVEVMSAQALQRTSNGEGLLVNADLPPVVFQQRRHYADAELRRLKGVAGSGLDRTGDGPP